MYEIVIPIVIIIILLYAWYTQNDLWKVISMRDVSNQTCCNVAHTSESTLIPMSTPTLAPTAMHTEAPTPTYTVASTNTSTPIISIQPTVGDTAANPIPTLPASIVKYGDVVKLKNLHKVYGGYVSICWLAGICGKNVTVSPLSVGNNTWKILGGAIGDPVKIGSIVELKSTSKPFSLSPCDWAINKLNCGVGVTMRTDAEFTKWEPNSNLRNWKLTSGTAPVGSYLTYDMTFNVKGLASRWPGHDGTMSVCGNARRCGWDLTLRPDHASYDEFKFER